MRGQDIAPEVVAAKRGAAVQIDEATKAKENGTSLYTTIRTRQAIARHGLKRAVERIVLKGESMGFQAIPFEHTFENVIIALPECFDQAAVIASRARKPAGTSSHHIAFRNENPASSGHSEVHTQVDDKRGSTMSFQAYLDNIAAKTGKSAADFKRLAAEKGFADANGLTKGTKATQIIDWLAADYGLGRGHAMAIVAVLKGDDARA